MRALLLTVLIGGATGAALAQTTNNVDEAAPSAGTELATITARVSGPSLGFRRPWTAPPITITCIDGKSTASLLAKALQTYPEEVQVAPGRHYIRGGHLVRMKLSETVMWLDAKAGQTYRLIVENTNDGERMYFIDRATGAVTGGLLGGESDPRPRGENCE